MITGAPCALETGVFELIYRTDRGESLAPPSASREQKASWRQVGYIAFAVAGRIRGPRPNSSAVLLVVALALSCLSSTWLEAWGLASQSGHHASSKRGVRRPSPGLWGYIP